MQLVARGEIDVLVVGIPQCRWKKPFARECSGIWKKRRRNEREKKKEGRNTSQPRTPHVK